MSPRPKQANPRHRRRVEVRYARPGHPARIGFSGNISTSGLLLQTPRVVPPGTLLEIELRFPAKVTRVQGQVVWAREGPASWLHTGRIGMGIRFVDPPADLEALAKGSFTPTDTAPR